MKTLKTFTSSDLEVLLTAETTLGSTWYIISERIKNGKRTQNETGKKYTVREVAHTRHWEEGEELFKKEVLKYLI